MSEYLRLYMSTQNDALRELPFLRIVSELPMDALYAFIYEGKIP